MRDYVNVNDASHLLGISTHGVRKLIHENRLFGQRRGGLYYISLESIEKYSQQRNIRRIGVPNTFSNSFVGKSNGNQKKMNSFNTILSSEYIEKIEELYGGDLIIYMSYFGKLNSIMLPDDCMKLDDLLNFLEPKYCSGGNKKFRKLILFISSLGGILESSVKFIDILKQYADGYEVIVPYMAKSAASLVCLASDKINMTTISELGPIDPIIENPSMPGNMVPAKAIDDFIKYYSNEADKGGVLSNALLKIFESKIDPYVLGSYKSALEYSQEEIRKALKGKIDDNLLENAVKSFTIDSVSHNHPITYSILSELGLKNIEQFMVGEKLNFVKILFASCNNYMNEKNIAKMFRSRDRVYEIMP